MPGSIPCSRNEALGALRERRSSRSYTDRQSRDREERGDHGGSGKGKKVACYGLILPEASSETSRRCLACSHHHRTLSAALAAGAVPSVVTIYKTPSFTNIHKHLDRLTFDVHRIRVLSIAKSEQSSIQEWVEECKAGPRKAKGG